MMASTLPHMILSAELLPQLCQVAMERSTLLYFKKKKSTVSTLMRSQWQPQRQPPPQSLAGPHQVESKKNNVFFFFVRWRRKPNCIYLPTWKKVRKSCAKVCLCAGFLMRSWCFLPTKISAYRAKARRGYAALRGSGSLSLLWGPSTYTYIHTMDWESPEFQAKPWKKNESASLNNPCWQAENLKIRFDKIKELWRDFENTCEWSCCERKNGKKKKALFVT